MFVYLKSKGEQLWTVGHYEPSGKWHPESDHTEEEKAASRAAYLNGGGGQSDTSLLRALAESQYERDQLKEKLAAANLELEQLRDWYPLESEATRVFVCVAGGDGDCGWGAAFGSEEDAIKWKNAVRNDPEDGRDYGVLDGELTGMRFWNNALEPMPSRE